MILIAHNNAVRPAALSQTPYHRVPYSGLFWDLKNPLRRNWKFFSRCTHAESDSRLSFQKWSKYVQDKWPKGRIALITERKQNTFWHPGAEPLGRFPPFLLCESAPWPLTYIPDFIHTGSGLGKL